MPNITCSIEINSRPQYHLCKFTTNTVSYYVKVNSLPQLQEALAKTLQRELTAHEREQSFQLQIDTTLIDFMQSISANLQRIPVVLPTELQVSVQHTPVFYSYRQLTAFKSYWNKGTDFTLFAQLSTDLIEMPYADEPRDVTTRQNQDAYHLNHGTGHASRQTILGRNFLEYIQYHGTDSAQRTVTNLSGEERACLDLAGFLFRVGRTSEASWSVDPSYGARSAAIFKHVALELDFNPTLVDMLAACFDYHQPLSFNQALEGINLEESLQKAQLFKAILKLSHESDLVRCEESKDTLIDCLSKTFTDLLPPTAKKEELADAFLQFAVALCRATGAPITTVSYRAKESELESNQTKAVITANAPKSTFGQLLSIRPQCLPAWASPTALWLASDEHVYFENNERRIWGHNLDGEQVKTKEGWTAVAQRAIPSEACIKQEQEYQQGHVSVYHATKRANYALDLLCRGLAEKEDKTVWIRTSKQKAGRMLNDIHEIQDEVLHTQDNALNMAWHLLSCSPTLWHNADYSSEESTVDYFFDNNSVINHDFDALIAELLDAKGLLVGEAQLRQDLYQKFAQLVNDSSLAQHGVIYQYLIPYELVNELAYISTTNGKPDTDNPNALDTLMQMKKAGVNVSNQNTLQVRLLVPKLLDAQIAPKLVVVNHDSLTCEQKEQFEAKINELVCMVLNGPSTGKISKEEVKEAKKPVKFSHLEMWGSRSSFFCTPSPQKSPSLESTGAARYEFDVFDFLASKDVDEVDHTSMPT